MYSKTTVFFFVFLLCIASLLAETIERNKLIAVQDNTPLTRAADKPAWNYLFDFLKNHTQADIEKNIFGNIGFTELNKQPAEYRGRIVKIIGKLVRCEKKTDFYESWILLNDKKDIPVSVCSLEIPDNFPLGNALSENVAVIGIAYKKQLFLSDKGEETITPTLLAKTLVRGKNRFAANNGIHSVNNVDKTDSVPSEKKTMQLDASFVKNLIAIDQFDWETLGDAAIPLEQQNVTVLELMSKLQKTVPESFLKTNVSHTLSLNNPLRFLALLKNPQHYRGKAFELKCNVVFVKEIPLNHAEQKKYNIPSYYRCTVQIADENAEVLLPFVPSEWRRNEVLKESATFIGVFVKALKTADSSIIPFFISPRIQWSPNTFLGNIGFDVASLEQVPPLSINDLKEKTLNVPPFREMPGRTDVVRRAFKFTEFDRAPFYGLLKCLAATPSGRLEQEAKRLEKDGKQVSITDLFNKPAETRGKPVLLHGTAKRIIPTLVEDSEVQALYGITKYYQIYLFTDESQGLPLVVCVSSLPDGMPTGAAPDFSEKITVAAVPYKLWIYESEAKWEEKDGNKPTYAPLLIGRKPIWLPKSAPPIKEPPSILFYGTFVVLLIVWIFLRKYKSNCLRRPKN